MVLSAAESTWVRPFIFWGTHKKNPGGGMGVFTGVFAKIRCFIVVF
jgi:hypothetical protein